MPDVVLLSDLAEDRRTEVVFELGHVDDRRNYQENLLDFPLDLRATFHFALMDLVDLKSVVVDEEFGPRACQHSVVSLP